jgi:hypothetical protein
MPRRTSSCGRFVGEQPVNGGPSWTGPCVSGRTSVVGRFQSTPYLHPQLVHANGRCVLLPIPSLAASEHQQWTLLIGALSTEVPRARLKLPASIARDV